MKFSDFFRKKSSGTVAKDRLKLVLISDRTNCSPDIMEQMKNDIIDVISKYVDIDTDCLDIKMTKADLDSETANVILANIPIKGSRNFRK